MECLFCAIAAGEIPATVVYRDGEVIAVVDVNPQAPVHVLVMPIAHHADIGQLCDADGRTLSGRLVEVAARLGRERGENGFRLVVNTGADGGQTVGHVHIHVLAGRAMTWPPG
jgi:histidine triad (HIT) family protein